MAGSAFKRGDDNSQKVVGLRDIILHDYNHRTKANDIAILKLAPENRLIFNHNIKPACLPSHR